MWDWVTGGLLSKTTLIAIAVLAGIVLNGFVIFEIIQGTKWKIRGLAAEGAIETIDKTGAAVAKAEDKTKDKPIDQALCAKGWMDGCTSGLLSMPKAPAKKRRVVKSKADTPLLCEAFGGVFCPQPAAAAVRPLK